MSSKKSKLSSASVSELIKSLNSQISVLLTQKPGEAATLNNFVRNELISLKRSVTRLKTECKDYAAPAKDKFFTTMGIEYSFIKSKWDKRTEDEVVKQFQKLSDKRQKWNSRSHQDGTNVIEVPSPVHRSWDDMLSNYKKMKSNAKKCKLIITKNDEGGGGGHIQLGMKPNWKTDVRMKFLRNIYMDITYRPYLNWMFNEYVDDKNANSFLTTISGIKFIFDVNKHTYYDFNKGNGCDDWMETKDYAVRYNTNYDTVELRFFDMPANEEMLEDHVEFANAYFKYIYLTAIEYQSNYDSYLEHITHETLNKFKSKKYVISEFNNFLIKLGLNPKRYKKYHKNYEARLALSKQNVVCMDYDLLNKINPNFFVKLKEHAKTVKEGRFQWNASEELFPPLTTAEAARVEKEKIAQEKQRLRELKKNPIPEPSQYGGGAYVIPQTRIDENGRSHRGVYTREIDINSGYSNANNNTLFNFEGGLDSATPTVYPKTADELDMVKKLIMIMAEQQCTYLTNIFQAERQSAEVLQDNLADITSDRIGELPNTSAEHALVMHQEVAGSCEGMELALENRGGGNFVLTNTSTGNSVQIINNDHDEPQNIREERLSSLLPDANI